jgi:hypothetical protein
MNCDAARRLLLADELPDHPSDDEARRHLAACPECRAAARRLAHIERQLPRLPVPPSSAKAVFVRRFVRTGGPVVRHVPAAWPTPTKERGLRKLSLAVAIAAMLAFLTLALWSWPRLTPAPAPKPEPAWVAEIQKERDRIHRLPAPQQVEQLTVLAKDMHERARDLAEMGDADGLASLARVYGDVVHDDLLKDARAVPAAERAAILKDIATELVTANSDFERSAAEKRNLPTSGPLHDLARAAADGSRGIQDLLRSA